MLRSAPHARTQGAATKTAAASFGVHSGENPIDSYYINVTNLVTIFDCTIKNNTFGHFYTLSGIFCKSAPRRRARPAAGDAPILYGTHRRKGPGHPPAAPGIHPCAGKSAAESRIRAASGPAKGKRDCFSPLRSFPSSAAPKILRRGKNAGGLAFSPGLFVSLMQWRIIA